MPVLTAQMEQMQVPGLVAIVQTPDGEAYQAALGLADVETEEPMAIEDHFRIGSITKTLTATVILQLVDEGMLELDDPLAPYFPNVDTNGATVRQALNMSSGIPPYTTAAFMQVQAADTAKVWTPDEVLGLVAGLPPTFPAGEGKEYSNTNYTMLGLIAEQVGGAPLSELLEDRIFTPLGMTECSAEAEDTTIPAPRSHGYQWGAYWDGEGTPPPMVDVTDWNMSWGFGTGEAICTAADMAIWANALHSGELLDPGDAGGATRGAVGRRLSSSLRTGYRRPRRPHRTQRLGRGLPGAGGGEAIGWHRHRCAHQPVDLARPPVAGHRDLCRDLRGPADAVTMCRSQPRLSQHGHRLRTASSSSRPSLSGFAVE